MASSPSSPPPTKTKEFPNPPTFIKRVLRNAIRINDLAHEVDASQSAPNTDLFPDFLKSALLNLETNALIFKTVIPNVSAEEAARLEHLRAANEAALVGVRAFGDADKVSEITTFLFEGKSGLCLLQILGVVLVCILIDSFTESKSSSDTRREESYQTSHP